MTLEILSGITWAVSVVALLLCIYWTIPLVKGYWAAAKAEAEEELRLKKATEALQEVADAREDEAA